MPIPTRGEVWLVDLGFAAKIRPALVLSIVASVDDRALVTLVPHTTAVRGTRFEIEMDLEFLRQGAFDTQQLITIAHAKLIRRLGQLAPDQLNRIEVGVCDWLGLRRN